MPKIKNWKREKEAEEKACETFWKHREKAYKVRVHPDWEDDEKTYYPGHKGWCIEFRGEEIYKWNYDTQQKAKETAIRFLKSNPDPVMPTEHLDIINERENFLNPQKEVNEKL